MFRRVRRGIDELDVRRDMWRLGYRRGGGKQREKLKAAAKLGAAEVRRVDSWGREAIDELMERNVDGVGDVAHLRCSFGDRELHEAPDNWRLDNGRMARVTTYTGRQYNISMDQTLIGKPLTRDDRDEVLVLTDAHIVEKPTFIPRENVVVPYSGIGTAYTVRDPDNFYQTLAQEQRERAVSRHAPR